MECNLAKVFTFSVYRREGNTWLVSRREGYTRAIFRMGALHCLYPRQGLTCRVFRRGALLAVYLCQGGRLACISERWNFLACISERMLYLACISDKDFTWRVSRSEGLFGVDLGERAILVL